MLLGAAAILVVLVVFAEGAGSTPPKPAASRPHPERLAGVRRGRAALARATIPGPQAPTTHGELASSAPGPNGAAAVTPLPAGWIATDHTIRVAGLDRSYLLLRPRVAAAGSLPVVMVLHGRGMTPASIERVTGLPAVTGPAILVFPAGYGQSWNAGACCGAAHRAEVNDVAFVTAVAGQVVADQPDAVPHDVYLVGYSNGGRLAYRMACVDPGTFAAVATVEAVPVATCGRTDPVPMMIVASRNDPLLTIQQGAPPKVIDGYVEPTVAATVQTWEKLDGCRARPTTSPRGDADVTTWVGCRGAARVAFVLYPGGSHAWPEGGPGRPSAQSLVWAFFGGVAARDGRAPAGGPPSAVHAS